MSDVEDPDQTGPQGITLVLENLSEEAQSLIAADVQENLEQSILMEALAATQSALHPEDLAKTRLVITGDMVASVNAREDRGDNPFTIDRGAGFVVGKTMPPSSDGTVDILLFALFVVPDPDPEIHAERIRIARHLVAHEAVHATLRHSSRDTFRLERREEFEYAAATFVSMAGEQVEEHLAEHLAALATGRQVEHTAEGLAASFEALLTSITEELPAIPPGPDYFNRGMVASLGALHTVWIKLAYLAAAIRNSEGFGDVPAEILALDAWEEFVSPWWKKYTELLGQVSMTTDVDVSATDEVLRNVAVHLQTWAREIGFDFHDTDKGGFFQVTRMSWLSNEPHSRPGHRPHLHTPR